MTPNPVAIGNIHFKPIYIKAKRLGAVTSLQEKAKIRTHANLMAGR